jgi:divalent metal cation (Fe/Co/Zn/Cd) transporter
VKRFRNLLPNLMVIAASINFILFCVKLYVGMVSSSISIYSDAVNNLFDVFSVMLAFFGVRFMVKKAPPEYPDGYSKTEHIVGLLMSVAVGITGAYFAYSSLISYRSVYDDPWCPISKNPSVSSDKFGGGHLKGGCYRCRARRGGPGRILFVRCT